MGNVCEAKKLGLTHKDDEDGELKRSSGRVDLTGGGGRLGRIYGWSSSRIVRVSRASGGKARYHRVHLSVSTAIQFYELQDWLGYDQPSKAVEWPLKAAATSISELLPMTAAFPDNNTKLVNLNLDLGCGQSVWWIYGRRYSTLRHWRRW
ncbi:unnamed protein product [Fraxinus pennsylvanica]|uniref:TCP domain-containing protein n=1 Tax=Fraxinus pennsylvanica TaxID=56036 RepID=A0AAD2A383_9LAMI|nr:unnamed protein product [Fraxinus pennsylvanica]